ncbi:peptide ABC transporter permease [Kiloniella spongiae]|uniref:Peptide ABC transporter permease n=1 Tax=Kiloniella spongiae TaxID=1489064 RepID=A0A0H2MI22_9PROT|nr:ABC transporter permease [Kiloniella spongiae]KLN62003.1 peptide ABC transporter permease [Kiloniella spongiae]
MQTFILKRIATAIPTLLGMSMLGFFMVALTPGDPVEMELRRLGVIFTPDQVTALRQEYGLDQPIFKRYLDWLIRLLHLDMGHSIASGRSVLEEFKTHLPLTLILASLSLSLSILLSSLFGITAALTRSQILGSFVQFFSIFLVSIPSFWLALLLLFIFALSLEWISLLGSGAWYDLVLPVLTLSLGSAATMGRLIRDRILAAMSEDYIRLAITKGLSPALILRRHILKSILPPLVTNWAVTFGALLGGSVIVENIFNLPGLGQMALQAVFERDFSILQAYLLFMGLIFFVSNFIADLLNYWLTPHFREQNSSQGATE